ncbi:hypothetical protein [Nocardioides montaniterrae]
MRRALVAMVLAVGLVTVPQTATPAAPLAPRAAATARPKPLGVNISPATWMSATRRRYVMTRIADAGARWIRMDIGWVTLEPTRGHFAGWYAKLVDGILADAHRHGLKVLAMFWLTPGWANGDAGIRAMPTRVADYGDALRWASRRWASRVDAWEIWNEPNHPDYLIDTSPIKYTRLLCAAYPAVKEYDSSPVVTGGLQYNDARFLRGMYLNGARRCFNAVGTHPYVAPADVPPDAPDIGVWRLTHTPAVRKVMTDFGDADKKIWMTEIGWSTGVSDDPDPWDQGVTPQVQARYLEQAVALVRQRYRYVGPIFWYRDVDGTDSNAWGNGLGLFWRSLTPKPALAALSAASKL